MKKYRPQTMSVKLTETEPYNLLRLFFSCIAKILEACNAMNHAPVIHNTVMG